MLSHLCQARLWTRPERKAITGTITNDSSHQLKTWPVLNNAIGGICHTEVLNAKETKTDYFLYSRENVPPIQSSPWNIKENNGCTEENHPSFEVNCSYSQISENPAYGLTPAWINNVQSGYISDDSSTETRSAEDEQEYTIYEGTTESESSSETKERLAEVHEEISPELNHKYSINSNKIEHIKHYLRSSSSNHFDLKPMHCRKSQVSRENCKVLSCSNNLEETEQGDVVISSEDFACKDGKQSETLVNSSVIPHVNSFNSSSSSNKSYSHQEFTTSHLSGKNQKPSLDKLQCGSTFLSQTNRPQCRVYELPFCSNNSVTEQMSEQASLWTESHLPSSNQNHRHNTYFNNDWYQLTLPKYQKLPLQKNSPPSPVPTQKISQNVSDILQKSSEKNPANISMVIMQCTYLHSHPKENSSVKDIVLPMGSLVAAMYEESDWLYVQTPHGEKGFVTSSNCMALGTLTDEYLVLTNGLDNLENEQDSESSEEESESEQLVSMKPLQETNYSKLAEVKANCGNNLQKNNMEKIFSMITKHGFGQVTFADQKCNSEELTLLNSKAFKITDTSKNEARNVNCNMQDDCKVMKDNSLLMPKNYFKDVNKIPQENNSNLQDHVESSEIIITPNKLAKENPGVDFCQVNMNFDENKDTNFIQIEELNIFERSEKINECDNYFSSPEYCKHMDEHPINKEASDIVSISSTNKIPSVENRNSPDENKVQSFETLTRKQDILNTTCKRKDTPVEEKSQNDLKCFHNKESSYLNKNGICFVENSKSVNVTSETEENVVKYKCDSGDNWKTASSILAIIENYNGKEEGTLSVKKGDLVTLLNTVNSEWMWVSSANGIEGYIPSVCTSQVGIF